MAIGGRFVVRLLVTKRTPREVVKAHCRRLHFLYYDLCQVEVLHFDPTMPLASYGNQGRVRVYADPSVCAALVTREARQHWRQYWPVFKTSNVRTVGNVLVSAPPLHIFEDPLHSGRWRNR
jgi:hypothetical protein